MSFHQELDNFVNSFNYNNKNCQCLDCVSLKQQPSGFIKGSTCTNQIRTPSLWPFFNYPGRDAANQCKKCICTKPSKKIYNSNRGNTVCPFGYPDQPNGNNFLRGNIFDDQVYLFHNKETGSNGTPQLNPRPMTRIGLSWRN